MTLWKKRTAPSIPVSSRIWELDFLRGTAIFLMVLYHLGFDLTELCGIRAIFGIRLNFMSSRGMQTAVLVFAGLFIVLCGISSTLTRSNARRGLELLGIAVLVTAASYFFNRDEVIYFGILHCLGLCILIYGWMLDKAGPGLLAAASVGVFVLRAVIKLLLRNTPIRFDWLLPFGITSDSFSTFDFFPLLPWLGVFLAGAALGKWIYSGRKSLIKKAMPPNVINFAGRHTLIIYIVHQPVFLAVIYALGLMK
jgi:uncharacterized membrane protein